MRRPPRLATTLAATLLALGALASDAHARDLQGRLGLGYNSQFANSATTRVPGVAVKYAFTRDLAAEAIVAIATTSPSNTATGIKFYKNIFLETNLNFYATLGGALLSANNRTGAQFIGAFGAEFFIPGLESLGFSMETGMGFDNLSGSFALRTLGVSFLDAGIRFYF